MPTLVIREVPKTLLSSLETCIANYSLDCKLFHARQEKQVNVINNVTGLKELKIRCICTALPVDSWTKSGAVSKEI